MSTVSRISQRDARRQEILEQRRMERQARLRQQRELEVRKREQAVQEALKAHQMEVEELQALEKQTAMAERAWIQDQLRKVEERKAALQAAQDEGSLLHRIAMHWQYLPLIAILAKKVGYVELAEGTMVDGLELQRVDRLFRGPNGQMVGIVRDGEGMQVVSHDRKAADRFVATVARLLNLERIFEQYQASGAKITPEILQNGEIWVELTLPAGSTETARMQIKTRPDGDLVVDIQCVKGRACHDLVQQVATAVDGEVIEARNTQEYYETEERQRMGGQQDVRS